MLGLITACSTSDNEVLPVSQARQPQTQVVQETATEEETVQTQAEISQEEHDNNTDLSIINLVERAKQKYQSGIDAMQKLINDQKQKAQDQ